MNQYHDVEYLSLLADVLTLGNTKSDRTGTGTISKFGTSMRFDLSHMSIPLLTTKKMNINSIIHELIWFISGNTNTKYLNDNDVKIWNLWSNNNGDLGPIYGKQWRNVPNYIIEKEDIWLQNDKPYIDQLQEAIDLINTNPTSRRIVINSWNVSELNDMMLPPCHYNFSFYCKPYSRMNRLRLLTEKIGTNKEIINEDKMFKEYNIPKGGLSCKLDMRSNDMFLGCPFNIVQYSILTHMIAQITGYEAKELFYTCTDSHIYLDHIGAVKLQLSRDPYKYRSPVLKLNNQINSIDDFKYSDIEIKNYQSYSSIKAKVSK